MFNINKYEDVFDPRFKYAEGVRDTIDQHRLVLDGLFVDKILHLLPDLKRPSKHYPPKSTADLRHLHDLIVKSNTAQHTKLSLIYYLLLDCDASSLAASPARAESFADRAFMPERYRIFMTGLWFMDRMDFPTALENLTHPSLIPTFQEEILECLVKHAPAGGEDMGLALAYYHTVQPVLGEGAVDVLFAAIARTSVTEAFYFLRGQPTLQSEKMFETLLSLIIHEPVGKNAAARGTELVNLPFSPSEEKRFEEYLIHGAGKRVQRSRDFVMMRRIATGRFSEALAVSTEGSKAVGGLNWERLQEGLREGLGPRFEIGRMR